MKHPKALFACAILPAAILLLSHLALGQAAAPAQPPAAKPAETSAAIHEKQLDDNGSRAFAHNCARCHAAPDGFSPAISGTIVMHMRARASLSKKDEEAILRFLNP